MPTLLRTQWLSWLGNAIALLLMTSSGSAPDERRLLVSESAHRSTCQDVASIPSIQYSKHTVQQAYSTASIQYSKHTVQRTLVHLPRICWS